MFKLRIAFVLALLIVMTALMPSSHAQTWPDRPVRIIVPWAAGGITDVLARLIAQKLANKFGQPFIVENKPGASGNIGAGYVAASAPDGYTLLLTNPGAFATNQFLYRQLMYKPGEFVAICLLADFPNALLVNKEQPFRSAEDVIAYAKEHPYELNGGSSGSGSVGHLSIEMFKMLTDTKITNVFYRGAAASRVDLSAGRIQLVIDNIPSYLSEIDAGAVRMIAVGTKERLPNYPDVPTLHEAGVSDYHSTVWYALAAPKDTPGQIVDMLNKAVNDALKQDEVKKMLAIQSGIAMGGTPADADRLFQDETKRWGAVITAAGITPVD
ncbi:tripartite tricarboxylate transporter substrate binding protein [Bradyrhizobium sp. LHD-71]|uniref:Bug family tripartite tricarboxylate transporter substrate binding protein n=1 Tax=Bradyrhizobium sp. LHD-71 TaxID=3072141 RepID=UPI00280FED35|nr:tripartite tricarboxylate transporter substrate binding protein [Bradyrhizobium sp. LHD-71]MDQ8730440.1 tripartite tricarboxylate transporter substrate binding protein [Bradyrhizobium sp. LHD-71]